MVFRLFVSLAATLTMVSTLIAGARTEERFSAWQMLIEGNPSIADDASIDWRQRLILHALTPRQAEEYFAGRATADELILADGRTLSAALQDRTSPAGGLYVPLSVSCRLFEGVTDEPAANSPGRERSFQLKSADLTAQGGSASGCPIPQDAIAVVVQLRAQGAGGIVPRIKLWASGLPEPAAAALEEATEPFAADRTATMIVNLCAGPDCGPAKLRMKSSRPAAVEADLIGYFRPLSAADRIGAGPVFPLATEGLNNNFFGTDAGANNTTGANNSFFGGSAGFSNTTGSSNSFFGGSAGKNNNGSSNSFFGGSAGFSNTTGSDNSFFGRGAGRFNSTGFDNSFFGRNAGRDNTTGSANSFFGRSAGFSNTEGAGNSFFGRDAGFSNTTGGGNSFFGRAAGGLNTTGFSNSFFGADAGVFTTTGVSNSFFGRNAGLFNTTGFFNSFFGRGAGLSNTVEDNNTFIGALSNGAADITNATALGWRAQVSQSDSLVLGSIAGLNNATVSVNVGIGTPAPQRQLHLAGSNATFRMDRTADTAAFILVRTNSSGTPLKTFVVGTNASGANAGEFIINDLGQAVGGAGARRMTITNAGETHFTGTVRAPAFVQTSSLRYKSEVQTVADAIDLVGRLRGVRFVWKETGEPSLGLIAEEAADVVPELVAINEKSGQAEAVNYAALAAVLIEAVKEQQEQIRRQQNEIESHQSEIQTLKAQLSRLETLESRFVQMQSLLSELLGPQGHRTELVRTGDGR